MQVEIWSDVVCPWCYLGRRHLELALEGFPHRGEVEVTYRSFELDPGSPPEVTTPTVERLASKYGMTVAQAQEKKPLQVQETNVEGITAEVTEVTRGGTPVRTGRCASSAAAKAARPIAARKRPPSSSIAVLPSIGGRAGNSSGLAVATTSRWVRPGTTLVASHRS